MTEALLTTATLGSRQALLVQRARLRPATVMLADRARTMRIAISHDRLAKVGLQRIADEISVAGQKRQWVRRRKEPVPVPGSIHRYTPGQSSLIEQGKSGPQFPTTILDAPQVDDLRTRC